MLVNDRREKNVPETTPEASTTSQSVAIMPITPQYAWKESQDGVTLMVTFSHDVNLQSLDVTGVSEFDLHARSLGTDEFFELRQQPPIALSKSTTRHICFNWTCSAK